MCTYKEVRNDVNTLLLITESLLHTNSHQLHSDTGLPTGHAEDCPPVQEVGRDQGCLTGGVRLDQHQVNWVTHRQQRGRIRHLTALSCDTKNDDMI